jgi:hypothetical protein
MKGQCTQRKYEGFPEKITAFHNSQNQIPDEESILPGLFGAALLEHTSCEESDIKYFKFSSHTSSVTKMQLCCSSIKANNT